MAYVKLVLTVVFLATVVIFPVKKVEASCNVFCGIGDLYKCGGEFLECGCIAWGVFGGNCIHKGLITKTVEEYLNLCQSHEDCIKKGNGSFCAYFPNSELQHGWCFTSNVEAKHYFEVLSNPAIGNFLKTFTNSNERGFLKMPLEIVT